MSDQITALIAAIKESETQTREELRGLHESVKIMSEHFSEYWKHKAVYDEDKKHDDKFKKEMTQYMKESAPLLDYIKDQKNTFNKLKIAFFVALMFALLAVLGLGLK
jgi:adenylate kinase family enzyme